MGQVLSLPFKLLNTTRIYISGFLHYWYGPGRYEPYSKTVPTFRPFTTTTSASTSSSNANSEDEEKVLFQQNAQIYLYTLALNLYLYMKPHYRKATYRQDLIDNLRNVAIPGTGLPLSYIAHSRIVAVPFLLCTVPTLCFISTLYEWIRHITTTTANKTKKKTFSFSQEYAQRLLAPDDWFTYWRMNSIVAAYHALLNDVPNDYSMENKWTFLQEGVEKSVPVSPFLSTPNALVIKHRNEEGGLGIHFYTNATCGGDWILQERIDNSLWVSSLLPPNAPLSTFRVITCSRGAIGSSGSSSTTTATQSSSSDFITALSCVFRAGRAGAATDHDSILFDVDIATGRIGGGTTNAHWYRLWKLNTPWRTEHNITHHPDGNTSCSIPVTGQVVPNIQEMLQLACSAHYKLCPRVPFCGWDVVLSSHATVPICLLEVNLSCNFFRGSFDKKVYLDFMDDLLVQLQKQRLEADQTRKVFTAKMPLDETKKGK